MVDKTASSGSLISLECFIGSCPKELTIKLLGSLRKPSAAILDGQLTGDSANIMVQG